MSAYTKGPWHRNVSNRFPICAGDAPNHKFVALVLGGRWDEASLEEAEGNMNLVAAAPELLEALKDIIDIGKRDMSNPKYAGYFDTAREAIAKAEGQ